MQPAIGSEIGKHDDQPLFQRNQPDQVHEKCFARPIFANDEPNGRTAISDPINILDEFLDLVGPADLQMSQTQLRDDACAQRLNYGVTFAGLQLGHQATSFSNCVFNACAMSSVTS